MWKRSYWISSNKNESPSKTIWCIPTTLMVMKSCSVPSRILAIKQPDRQTKYMWHLHVSVLNTWFRERTKLKGMNGSANNPQYWMRSYFLSNIWLQCQILQQKLLICSSHAWLSYRFDRSDICKVPFEMHVGLVQFQSKVEVPVFY